MSNNQKLGAVKAGKKVVIIGSGLGGLAAACLLGKQGYSVKVLEKNADVGGRSSIWEKDGFRFDLGPSWYLMPDIFEKFYEELGESVHDYLDLKRLDPAYRIYFEEEKDSAGMVKVPAEVLDVRNFLQVREYFEKLEEGAGVKFDQYMKISAYQYEVAVNEFLPKSYNKITDFIGWRMMTEGRKLHVFESMDHYIQRYFKHPKIKKILEYSLVFLGSSPFKTPALYNIMNHVDFGLGVWYPQGGIFEITKSLIRIAEKYGVEIHLSTAVDKILVDSSGHATGVRVAGGAEFKADLVVSNADYAFTEMNLLEDKWRAYDKKYWEKRTWAPSAFILYLGLNKKFDSLLHHNLFFGADWVKNFDDIFVRGIVGENPSTYVCTPSKTDPAVAPEGCENVFMLTPIAPGIEVNKEEMLEKSLKMLEEKFGMVGVRESIIVSRVFTVEDFVERYNSYKGTALGMAHDLLQTAYFRPKQKSSKVKGLYYVGAGTHPGIGMPMVLLSAQILAKGLTD